MTTVNSLGVTINGPIAVPWGALPSSGGPSPNAPGTGHVPGDLLTMSGGAFTRAAVISVLSTQVVSATVAAGGSGGTNGTQTVTGTTGSGTKFQASVTVSGNAIVAVLSITVAGDYTANPTSIAAEPVTGASLVGAQLNVVMGVLAYQVVDWGYYSVFPQNPVVQGSSSGSGVGANFTLTFGTVAAGMEGPRFFNGQAGNANFFLGGSPSSNSGERAGANCYGNENTYIGNRAGGLHTFGNQNVAVGCGAFGIGANQAVVGSTNTAVGSDSLRNIILGSNNTALGTNALKFGSQVAGINGQTGVGANALANWNSASSQNPHNTAVGLNAGQGAASASFLRCTLLGESAGNVLSSGSDNVCLGYLAGNKLNSGANNTIIGSQVATTTLTTGQNNVLIGTNSSIDAAASGTNNSIRIGAGSTAIFSATGCGTPATALASVSGNLGIGQAGIASAILSLIPGTTAMSQINMPSSTAPTSPNDGDFWYDGTNLKFRHGATTQTITWT